MFVFIILYFCFNCEMLEHLTVSIIKQGNSHYGMSQFTYIKQRWLWNWHGTKSILNSEEILESFNPEASFLRLCLGFFIVYLVTVMWIKHVLKILWRRLLGSMLLMSFEESIVGHLTIHAVYWGCWQLLLERIYNTFSTHYVVFLYIEAKLR